LGIRRTIASRADAFHISQWNTLMSDEKVVHVNGASIALSEGDAATLQSVGASPAQSLALQPAPSGLQTPQSFPEYAEAMIGASSAQQRPVWTAIYLKLAEQERENSGLRKELTELRDMLKRSEDQFHEVDKDNARLRERRDAGVGIAVGSFALNTLGSFLLTFAGFSTDRPVMRAGAFILGAVALSASVLLAFPMWRQRS
jgi:hypothetical protein